jgi:hypothetical protein
MNIKGKTIKSSDSMWDGQKYKILFTDGSLLILSSYTTGAHNDRWTVINPLYFESEKAYQAHLTKEWNK